MWIFPIARYVLLAYYCIFYTIIIIIDHAEGTELEFYVYEAPCPDIESQIENHDVDLAKLQGRWYEYARYGYPSRTKCTAADYKLRKDGSLYMMYHGIGTKYTDDGIMYDQQLHLSGHLKLYNNNVKTRFYSEFNSTLNLVLLSWTPNPKWIIGFNYFHYLIYWCCWYTSDMGVHQAYVNILTRQRELINQKQDYFALFGIWNTLEKFGYYPSNFSYVDQEGCVEELLFTPPPPD